MEKEIIIKFITDQLTAKEKAEVLVWISQSSENREEYYQLKNLWALTDRTGSIIEPVDKVELEKFQKNIQNRKFEIIKVRIITLFKYAAVILIAFFAGKLAFENKKETIKTTVLYNEVSVPSGQVAHLKLSDGTSISINSCSKLKYPTEFKSGERRVFLSGEAYFSVSKNEQPFLVETGNRVVKVLGTKFNILAYPNDKYYQATLVDGRITLLDTTGNELVQLKPGEQYFLDIAKNTYSVKSVKTNIYDSWKDGLYVFDHETLEILTQRLERIYAVKIIIKNDRIRNYKFTGTISRNAQFEQILKIIQISAPVKYKIKKSNGAVEEVTLY